MSIWNEVTLHTRYGELPSAFYSPVNPYHTTIIHRQIFHPIHVLHIHFRVDGTPRNSPPSPTQAWIAKSRK